MNFVFLSGYLQRFEERALTSGKTVCSLRMKVLVNNGDPLYFDVEAWDLDDEKKNALNAGQSKLKISVQGRLKEDKWEDKETKQPRSKMKVVAAVVSLDGVSDFSGQKTDHKTEKRAWKPKRPEMASVAKSEDDVPF